MVAAHIVAMIASSRRGSIVAEQVGFAHGATPVLGDVSFKISAGEHVAIVGRSGVGKSTLLHLLAGLLRPTHGHVSIDGEAPSTIPRKPVLMFQRPALLPWLTVAENILVPLQFSGLLYQAPEATRSKVTTLIKQIGLEDKADALPVHLSGGQQQRVALARALIAEPTVLLLDEPFSALDGETRAALRHDTRALARARAATLVTVTHDLADAAALADRILVVGGRPANVADDFALDAEAEQRLRLRLSHLRQAA